MEATDWMTAMRTVAEDAVCLDLYVNPGSSAPALGPYDPWRQRIHANVEAPASAGKANKELIGMLADLAGVPKGNVHILRGATTRRKTVRLEGVDIDEVTGALGAVLENEGDAPR